MSSGHHNRDNLPRLSKLEWVAFCYIADELEGRQRDAFELRLSVDQRAREAVTTAVENFDLIKTTLESERSGRKLSERLPSRVRSGRRSLSSPKSGRASDRKLACATTHNQPVRQAQATRSQPVMGSPKRGTHKPSSLRPSLRHLRLETVAVITTAVLVMMLGNLIWNPRFQFDAPVAPIAAVPADSKFMPEVFPVSSAQNGVSKSDPPDSLNDQSIGQSIGQIIDRSSKESNVDSDGELTPIPVESRDAPVGLVESMSLENQPPSSEQRAVALFQFWTKEARNVPSAATFERTTEAPLNEPIAALLSMAEEQSQYEESDQVILEDGNWLFEALWEKTNQAKPLSHPQSGSPTPNENKPNEFWG